MIFIKFKTFEWNDKKFVQFFLCKKIQKIFIKSCIIFTFLPYFRFLNSACPILIQYFWIVQYNKTKREKEDKSWLKGKEGSQRRRKGRRRKARNHLSLPTRFCVSRPRLGKRWKQNQFYGRPGIDAPPIGIDPISIFGKTRNCPPAFSSGSRWRGSRLLVGPRSNLRPSPVPCFVVPKNERTDEIRSFGEYIWYLENIAVS